MPWGAIAGAVVSAGAGMLSSSKAAKQSLSGFNYLTGKSGVQGSVDAGNAATSNIGQLLGTQPMKAGTQSGFDNYLNSTGYNFQKNEGMNAITGSAAARGILNSGSTGKALEQYGQGLSGTYFNNYLNQLGGQAGRGLQASQQIGQAGTTGGGNAGQITQGSGTAAGGMLGGAVTGAYNNYFAGPASGGSSGGAYMQGGNWVPGAQGFQ